MTVILAPLAKQKFFDNNGEPLVGGLLFTYLAGTTTKTATYVDSTGITPNTNPIVLDARGEADIWLDTAIVYKFVLSPRGDSDPPTKAIWTVDNVAGGYTGIILSTQFYYARTAAEIAASVTPVNYAFVPGNPRRQGAPIDGITSARTAFAAQDSTGEQVYVSRGTYFIDSNITLNSDYIFETGAILKVATGVTIQFTTPSTEKWSGPRQIFQCVGTGKVLWLNCSPTVMPEWFITNTTPGVTDLGVPLCADFVVNGADSYCPAKTSGGAGRCTLLLTGKSYLTSIPLNWNQRDYFIVEARGAVTIYSTSTTYIIDTSSTDHCRITTPIVFTSTTASSGWLLNRCTTNPFTQYNEYDGVSIYVGSNHAANGGQGTYAIINCRAELNVFRNCHFQADIAKYETQTNDPSFPPASGTADNVIVSCEVNTWQNCEFIRHDQFNYGLIHKGVAKSNHLNCYAQTASLASGSVEQFCSIESVTGCEYEFLFENTKSFAFINRTIYDTNFKLQPQVAFLNTTGVINLDSANNTGMVKCEVECIINSSVTSGKVIRWSGGGPSCQMFQVKIRTGGRALITGFSLSSTNCSEIGLVLETEDLTGAPATAAANLFWETGTTDVNVSGNTNITSMTAFGNTRKTIVLLFSGTPTVTDGSNLKLNGNFVASADDALTLYCDGTNFYEIARSAN